MDDPKNTTYHRILRVSALVLALVLIFESGLLFKSTQTLAVNTHQYLAGAVGMSASVQPTELNQYTAALTQKERELQEREAALAQREISVGLSTETGDNATATYVLSSILFILLVLILLNYALDYLRTRERRDMQTV
jgi:hypothetical protein